jgi:hypothetical protein
MLGINCCYKTLNSSKTKFELWSTESETGGERQVKAQSH